jgi:hypothetical protein
MENTIVKIACDSMAILGDIGLLASRKREKVALVGIQMLGDKSNQANQSRKGD